MEIAVLALGCFWGPEIKFSKIDGIIKTEVGYCGGNSSITTYKEVCTGNTNHAEVVKLDFDEKIITYEKILKIFFQIHDPTTLNSQGPDFGTQYRSEIFYLNDNQKMIAEKVLNEVNERLSGKVVTKISLLKNYCPAEEYHQKYLESLHIPGAIFFDIDENSRKDTALPHMLVDQMSWDKIVSNMGIKKNDEIVIYDNSDVISSCRGWFNFIYYGHDPKLINVLNGGLRKWLKEKKKVTDEISNIDKSDYKGSERKDLVKSKQAIDQNIDEKIFTLIDARSRERFEGKIPEPRKGLRSGCIKNSFCIPFNDCLNDDKTFKNKDQLKKIFKTSIENLEQKKIVFSCGSGVTACVLALAYSLINDKYLPCIYDGSWAEYGLI